MSYFGKPCASPDFLIRFLNGVGLGFVLAVVSVYIVEIATTDMRGILGCFVQFQVKMSDLKYLCSCVCV